MSVSYITDTDQFLSARFPEVKKQVEKDAITDMIKAVSAFIDTYTRRKSGYYLPSNSTSVKRVRGAGSRILQLPRHVLGNISVENVPSQSYYENEENGWLYRNDQGAALDGVVINADFDCRSIWLKGKIYNVTTIWGFAAIPDDISEATAQIVIRWWETNAGILGQINPAGFVVERDLPESAQILLENWIKGEFEI